MLLQAEAIRKILGQDSSRKKQEDKMKKRQEELAQVLAVVKIWHIKLMTKQSVMKIYYIKFLTKQVILVPQFAGKGCQCSDARIKHH